MYVSSAVLELGSLITYCIDGNPAYEPLYWLAFYIIALTIHLTDATIFWRFNMIIGCISFLLIVLYFVASLPTMDFNAYVFTQSDPIFSAGPRQFLYYFPLASWFYVGIEVLTLSCEEVNEVSANKNQHFIF